MPKMPPIHHSNASGQNPLDSKKQYLKKIKGAHGTHAFSTDLGSTGGN